MKRYFKMLVCLAVTIICVIIAVSSSANVSAATEENQKWIGAWGTTPARLGMSGLGTIGDMVGEVTARVVLTPTASGQKFRVKISNYYGTEPLKINEMTVAKSLGNSKIDTNKINHILVDGQSEIVVKPGEAVYSDPVSFPVK
ncbi:MAG: hypothetical protein J6V06_02615, partial [Clostridia bacterium]|nr:hypothetical protein [Clostridia bacterium]